MKLGIIYNVGHLSTILLSNRIARRLLLVIALHGVVILAILYSYLSSLEYGYLFNLWFYPVLVPTCIILFLLVSRHLFIATQSFDEKINSLRIERQEITKKIEGDDKPSIFNIIELSLNQLNEYYTLNKAQATTSFRFSIAAIVLGLSFILTGIALNYSGTKTIEVTYLAGISGVLLEFIGGAYFFMYKKSLEQVNFFFGQLIKVQDTMLAINLADAIKEV